MSVNGNADSKSSIRRHVFPGDRVSDGTWPAERPERVVITARGKRRQEGAGRKAKTPAVLIQGQAKRPHSHPKDHPPSGAANIRGHYVSDAHAKLTPLTRSFKRNK